VVPWHRAPLAAGLGPAGAAKVAAAVLLFRSLTYLLPIPLGALAYLGWRHVHRRRHPVPAPLALTGAGSAAG
jgi:putative heme transporter